MSSCVRIFNAHTLALAMESMESIHSSQRSSPRGLDTFVTYNCVLSKGDKSDGLLA